MSNGVGFLSPTASDSTITLASPHGYYWGSPRPTLSPLSRSAMIVTTESQRNTPTESQRNTPTESQRNTPRESQRNNPTESQRNTPTESSRHTELAASQTPEANTSLSGSSRPSSASRPGTPLGSHTRSHSRGPGSVGRDDPNVIASPFSSSSVSTIEVDFMATIVDVALSPTRNEEEISSVNSVASTISVDFLSD